MNINAPINYHLSGALGGDLTKQKFLMPHCLGIKIRRSNPFYQEEIRWGFELPKGRIPHPTGTYFVQNQSNPHPSPPTWDDTIDRHIKITKKAT